MNLWKTVLSVRGLTSPVNARIWAVVARSRTTAQFQSACHSETAFTNLPLLQMCVEDGKARQRGVGRLRAFRKTCDQSFI